MFYITFIQAKLRESQIQSDSALTEQIQAHRFNSMTKTAIKTSKIRVRNKTEKIRLLHARIIHTVDRKQFIETP